jgi:hypothetical protein
MSTAANVFSQPLGAFPEFAPKPLLPKPSPVRRQTTPSQGRALEALGHAIEYLVDSRMFAEWESPSDAVAVRMLMACSRDVFAECAVIQPWHQRVQKALLRRLHTE